MIDASAVAKHQGKGWRRRKKHRIGVIGLGKIAQDQHLPVIAGHPGMELVATASTRGLKAAGARHAFTHTTTCSSIPRSARWRSARRRRCATASRARRWRRGAIEFQPFQLVADAFLMGKRSSVEPFVE